MLNRLSKRVSFFLLKNGSVDEDNRVVVQYGLEYLFALLLFGGFLLGLGLILSQELQVFGLGTGFLLLRNTLGGYHAKTEKQCSVLTFIIFSLDLALVNGMGVFGGDIFNILIPLLFLLVVLIKPLDHPNKRFTPIELQTFRKRSIRNMLLIIVIIIVINHFFGVKGFVFTLPLLLGALTAILAVVYAKFSIEREVMKNVLRSSEDN